MNDKIKNELDLKGYCVLKAFSQKSVSDIYTKFLFNKKNTDYFTTHASNDLDLKVEVHDQILSFTKDFVKQEFDNYKLLWGNYMVKKPGTDNMLLHADWTYVEEPQQISFNLWSPLVNTTLKNGCLWVVPYSHKVVKEIRGVGLPRFYELHETLLKKKYGIPLFLKPGEAVIYDHRLIHFSYPNYSKKIRPALTMILAEKEIPYYHYFFNKDSGLIEKYCFNSSSFLLNLNFFEKPNQNPVALIEPETIKALSSQEINKNLKPISFFNQLKNRRMMNKLNSL